MIIKHDDENGITTYSFNSLEMSAVAGCLTGLAIAGPQGFVVGAALGVLGSQINGTGGAILGGLFIGTTPEEHLVGAIGGMIADSLDVGYIFTSALVTVNSLSSFDSLVNEFWD